MRCVSRCVGFRRINRVNFSICADTSRSTSRPRPARRVAGVAHEAAARVDQRRPAESGRRA